MTTTTGKLLTAHDIAEQVLDTGGITLDLPYRAVTRTNGYAVSREGFEIRLPRALIKGVFDHRHLAIEALASVLEYQRACALPALAYIGLWIEDGACYVDVSDVVLSRDDALAIARETGQLAIYDFAAGEAVNLYRRICDHEEDCDCHQKD